MKTEIVITGNEILSGYVTDTNSNFITKELFHIGFDVHRILVLPDDYETIFNYFKNLNKDEEILVIFTGGLGPTSDDLTKDAISNALDITLKLDEAALKDLISYFEKRKLQLKEIDKRVAFLPAGAISFPNELGTARGFAVKKNNINIISLPGVPIEMEYMFKKYVIPYLISNFKKKKINSKIISIYGINETGLSEKLMNFEKQLPTSIKISYIPFDGFIKLKITETIENSPCSEELLPKYVEKLKHIIPEYIFGYDEDTMASVIVDKLRKKGQKLAIAESCTGGFISHLITSIPGVSDVYIGGFVVYHNELKKNILSVDEDILNKHGAVSKETAEAMARGLRKLTNADFVLTTTGIAGPTGGTEQKPVGTLWIAVANKTNVWSDKFYFGFQREKNIVRFSYAALNFLRNKIIECESLEYLI